MSARSQDEPSASRRRRVVRCSLLALATVDRLEVVAPALSHAGARRGRPRAGRGRAPRRDRGRARALPPPARPLGRHARRVGVRTTGGTPGARERARRRRRPPCLAPRGRHARARRGGCVAPRRPPAARERRGGFGPAAARSSGRRCSRPMSPRDSSDWPTPPRPPGGRAPRSTRSRSSTRRSPGPRAAAASQAPAPPRPPRGLHRRLTTPRRRCCWRAARSSSPWIRDSPRLCSATPSSPATTAAVSEDGLAVAQRARRLAAGDGTFVDAHADYWLGTGARVRRPRLEAAERYGRVLEILETVPEASPRGSSSCGRSRSACSTGRPRVTPSATEAVDFARNEGPTGLANALAGELERRRAQGAGTEPSPRRPRVSPSPAKSRRRSTSSTSSAT